jgi:predicted phage terminase large subunit-like protein
MTKPKPKTTYIPPADVVGEQMMEMNPKVRREIARRVLARRSLIAFTQRFLPTYTPGWVHLDIARRLEKFKEDVEQKKSPRLMLLMPPRHGKSELGSIRFPGWCLGHHPEWEYINCGYNLDLPMKFSRKVREMIRDPAFTAVFDGCEIDKESQSAEAWNTTAGGGFTAAGVGGGITGKGAHILGVDDPIKNQQEADSIVTRDSLSDWFWSTAYSRLAPGGGVLLIQTCWSDDDLAGRLQQRMADAALDPEQYEDVDNYTVVKYPAEALEWEYHNKVTDVIDRFHEPLDQSHVELRTKQRELGVSVPDVIDDTYTLLRMPGEALHPERFTEKMIRRLKANQPPRVWSALYQQNPVPDEGIYFKDEYFMYESVSPGTYRRKVFQAWDFAIGTKQQNDFTVGVTLIQDEQDCLHMVELVRFKGDSFTIVEEILDAAVRWGSDKTAPLSLGFEDGQIWKAIKPLLSKRMRERLMYPSHQTLQPLTDKLARARPLQGRMQQNRIFFPTEASWLPLVKKELLRFPAGAHDDIVDAMAWAVTLAVGSPPPRGIEPPKVKSWKDKLTVLSKDGTGHMAA